MRQRASLGQQPPGAARPAVSVAKRLLQGLLVALTNPKLIIFFLALFPPFIQADRPVLPQLVLLVATFCLLSLIIHCSYTGGRQP